MPKIKLVSNVSEYGLFRGFARTRARLAVSAFLATAATLGFGLWSAHFVLEVSSSVELNLALITFNMMLMLVAAYLQTVLVGDLAFSGPWREQVILGEQPTKGASVQDHNAEFMIVLLLLVLANAFIVNVGSGGFLDTYHNEGFFRSRLRSDSAEERRAALEYMTEPINFELWGHEGVQKLVTDQLEDPDIEVRRIAIWNSGEMKVAPARELLLKFVTDPNENDVIRAESAEALGTMGIDDKARSGLEAVLSDCKSSTCSPRLKIGLLRGIALMKSPLSVPVAREFTTDPDELVALHAFWVLRNSQAPELREQLRRELETAKPLSQRQCALLDTLKMVAAKEDVIWARRQFDAADNESKCEPVIWEERNERQHYILYSDSFRVKFLKIVANASGGEHKAWFERILSDPEQTWRVREVAGEIVKRLNDADQGR